MAEKKDEKEKKVSKGGGGLKVVLIALPVVMAATGGGVYFALANKTAPQPTGPQIGHTEKLETIVVNLDEPGGNRYLKVSLALETKAPFTEKQQKLSVRVRDAIIVYLSGLRINEVQQVNAKTKVKQDLRKKANAVLGEGTVNAVYFQEFVIQ
jgi:flagellar FliL protein